MGGMEGEARNRLSDCTSPYLLQHSENPVNWQPWDDEALELARGLDRPVLVSIGYAACHWCHVMEHESFDDEQTAEVMNSGLICIKVDREERPDVDALYMAACQATSGSGGWPLNVFIDPHTLKPFFAGTYFPPAPLYGRPSWQQVVQRIVEAWRDERDRIVASSDHLVAALSRFQQTGAVSEGEISEILARSRQSAIAASRNTFDSLNGGFGGAPKFPHPMELEMLLRGGDDDDLAIVSSSLEAMAGRGLFDHLGGGWHRYCVDAAWAVPHFEKMLYDNSLLLRTHGRARRLGVGNKVTHDRVIGLTLEWLEREMLDSSGGVWSTQDADSENEEGISEEGEFYLWKPEEVFAVLTKAESDWACLRWGITETGNFEGTGRSVLSLNEAGELPGGNHEKVRLSLLKARSKRAPPGTDDKVLTAWNGMLLAACAELPEPAAERIGGHVARGMLTHSTESSGRVIRTRRGTTEGGEGFLDDYAWSALSLFLWGCRHDEVACVERGFAIIRRMLDLFVDSDGGFWLSGPEHTKLPVRQRSDTDSAVPAGAGVAIEAILLMHAIWPESEEGRQGREIAEASLRRLGEDLVQRAPAYRSIINAAQGMVEPAATWHIHHSGEEPAAVSELRSSSDWNKIVLSSTSPIGNKDRGDAPWAGWLCEGMTCKPPVFNEEELVWQGN